MAHGNTTNRDCHLEMEETEKFLRDQRYKNECKTAFQECRRLEDKAVSVIYICGFTEVPIILDNEEDELEENIELARELEYEEESLKDVEPAEHVFELTGLTSNVAEELLYKRMLGISFQN